MTQDDDARRKHAEELRQRISDLTDESGEHPENEDDTDIRPGESPKEYVDRRSRAIDVVKKDVESKPIP